MVNCSVIANQQYSLSHLKKELNMVLRPLVGVEYCWLVCR